MLTSKQASLFNILEISPERELEIRKHHKLMTKLGAKHAFTGWLQDCLKAKWQKENERGRLYLGD